MEYELIVSIFKKSCQAKLRMLYEQMTNLRNSGIKQKQHLGSQLHTKVYNLFLQIPLPIIQG